MSAVPTILVVVSLLVTPLALPSSPGGQTDVDALTWLEGEWERPTRGGVVIERWERTGAGLRGEAVVRRGDEETRTEALLVVPLDDALYYIAKPRENPYPVAFRLVSTDGGAFVFENTTHDFPQRIIYRQTGQGTMSATIEGPGDDGPRAIEFRFQRR